MAAHESSATPTSAPAPLSRADLREAHSDTQPAVDLLILDYLLHKTTEHVLQEDGSPAATRTADLHIGMIDSFLLMFKANHPDSTPPPDTLVRLQIARFASLYTRRARTSSSTTGSTLGVPSAEELAALRSENRARAEAWHAACRSSSPPNAASAQYSASAQGSASVQDSATVRDSASAQESASAQGSASAQDSASAREPPPNPNPADPPASLTLLDLLPSFIRLTSAFASRNANWVTSEVWLRLAACFMACASVEAEPTFTSPAYAAREAFAWGPLRATAPIDEAARRENDIFLVLDPDANPNAGFTMQRQTEEGDAAPTTLTVSGEPWLRIYLAAVTPLRAGRGAKIIHAGRPITLRAAIELLDSKVRIFLRGLAAALEEPLLVQLEKAAAAGGQAAVNLVIDGEPVEPETARRMLRIFSA